LSTPAIDPYAELEELGRLLRERTFTSLELTRFYLERLERFGPQLGAVVTITRELAEQQARAADAEIAAGRWRGPLHGIPYGVKDLLATRGIPTTWGAEPYRDQRFDFDATVIRRLSGAGAVLCAKLAMVELAGGFGYNEADASFTGPGRTPWNLQFWSGGSSSGPGAAVAAALVPFAIGSETSGSIITPAAFSGVTGFRPTYGVVSRHGAMALCWTLDKLGPMARSATDCELVMRTIAGYDDADPSMLREPLELDSPAGGPLRIAMVSGTWERVQPEVRDNFLASIAMLREAGQQVIEIEYPDLPYGPVVGTIVNAEGASAFEDLLRSGGAKQLRNEQDRVGGYAAAATLAIDYLRAMRLRRQIGVELAQLFERVDLIAAPSRATVSFPIGVRFQDAYPGISSGPSIIGSMNLLGAPGISVPNGFGENGLPTAIQFNAAPLADRHVLTAARVLQERTRFHRLVPPGFA
jgi:aspartyl-tRNA(Asn)/glutamyl-tRNA(Gln) amidotransferase subunit A